MNDGYDFEDGHRQITIAVLAKEAVELIDAMVEEEGVDDESKFWTGVQVLAAKRAGNMMSPSEHAKSIQPKGFSRAEYLAFEREVIPFGKFKGSLVKDVPASYLYNLCDPNPWIAKVRRYVNSEWFSD